MEKRGNKYPKREELIRERRKGGGGTE